MSQAEPGQPVSELAGAPVEAQRESREPERLDQPAPTHSGHPPGSAISQCIEQVNSVVEELKQALDQMEEVLETLELAERQQIDDEREIDSLQRALRRLQRPVQPGPPRH